MGMEAEVACRWSSGEAQVKALLETRELILRGGIKRTLPIATLKAETDGDELVVITADETYRLALGAEKAARWKAKIETLPPSLRAKLGLKDGEAAYAIGALQDAVLREAVETGLAVNAADAKLCIADVASEDGLTAALDIHARDAAGKPLWIVHGKGPKAALGDNAVRAVMRARGFIDSKSCAVSETRSATRYTPRQS